VRELLKAALSHNGTAMLDIISPCVTFNNADDSTKGYSWGKEHEEPLHDITFVPVMDEIIIEDYDPGEVRRVEMHDGSIIQLHKLEEDYDPTDRMGALHRLEWARQQNEFITGLVYYDASRRSLAEVSNIGQTPLSMLPEEKLRPSREALAAVMDSFI
jgi:2-oxoglutarate ferredoxin oxidoreductase subunit beta